MVAVPHLFICIPAEGPVAPRQALLTGMTKAQRDNSQSPLKSPLRIGSVPLCQISQSKLLSQGHDAFHGRTHRVTGKGHGQGESEELGQCYLSLPRDVQSAKDNRRETPARGRPGQTRSWLFPQLHLIIVQTTPCSPFRIGRPRCWLHLPTLYPVTRDGSPGGYSGCGFL